MEVNSGIETFVNPEDNLIDSRQLEVIIDTVVANLPPRCREVYNLHRNDDLSNKEIASRMNISVKTVENQMTIALKRLKEQLAPYYEQIFALIVFGIIGK
jgi:RNA polymerase sigma-70 factor (ECF subfamily)